MSKQETLERETLSWVKQELDTVLDRARHALESYIDNQTDTALLGELREQVHRVNGTLQMVELYGAATLAHEIEEVVQGLLDNAIRNQEEALEVLLRAILQLPDYLEHIQAGNRDLPVVLLPILNDLRTARGVGPLSESGVFFSPALSLTADPPFDEPSVNVAGEDVHAVARRLRPIYQIGLLGWFRGQEGQGSLDKVKAVSIKLYELSQHAASKRLWWTTAALIDALRLGALEPSVTVKSLLGQIDREIKRLGDRREDEFARDVPEELTRNILYFVATADNRSELIEEVKRAYGLEDLRPNNHALQAARDPIDAPNTALLNKVAQAVREELVVIRDIIEQFSSSACKDAASLEPAIPRLRTVASTLTMLGLAHPAARLVEQTDVIRGIVRAEISPSEAILISIASAILEVETQINNFALSRVALTDFAQGGEEQTSSLAYATAEAEYRRLLAAVTSEALRDLGRVKEIINNFVNAPQDSTPLAELSACFERVKGAAAMVDGDAASALPTLLSSISNYVSSRLLDGGSSPDVSELEFLADAITSVECIIEALGKGAAVSHATLEIGRAGVAELGYPVVDQSTPSAPVVEPLANGFSEAKTRSTDPSIDALENASERRNISAPAWTAIESASAPVVTGATHDQASLGDIDVKRAAVAVSTPVSESPAEQSAPASSAAEPQPTKAVSIVGTLAENGSHRATLAGEADEEILAIFIEEAEEEFDAIRRLVPQWREASGDRESLIALRRSFHTLKGSGRLVGAQALGEFAWAFENLLNRVIDGTVPPAGHIHDALDQSHQALAELIAQIKGDGAPKVGVVALISAAYAMSKPDYVPAPDPTPRESGFDPDAPEVEVDSSGTAEDEYGGWRDLDRPAHAADDPVRSWRDYNIRVDQHSRRRPTEMDDDESPPRQPDNKDQISAYPLPGSSGAIEVEEAPLSAGMPPQQAQPTELKTSAAEREAPRDQALLAIFVDEADQHLAVLNAWLKTATGVQSESLATDELVRALHTLNGSARIAAVPEIAQLCEPLEQYTAARAGAEQPIAADVIPLLQQASETIGAIIDALKHPEKPLPASDQLRDRIEILLRDNAPTDPAEADSAPATESPDREAKQAGTNDDTDALSTRSPAMDIGVGGLENSMSDAASNEQPRTDPPIDSHAGEIEPKPVDVGSAPPRAPQDRDVIETFRAEARDLLDVSDNAIQRWRNDPADKETVTDLRRQLHTLKGGARMAGCAPMGDLSHALESLIVSIVNNSTVPNPAMFDTM